MLSPGLNSSKLISSIKIVFGFAKTAVAFVAKAVLYFERVTHNIIKLQ